jgi:hypothetical protein
MKSLSDILLAPGKKDAVIVDFAQLLEHSVSSRGGFKGMAMKTGLSMLKSARPDIMTRGATRMLPEFVSALDPLFQRFQEEGGSDFAAYLKRNADEAVKRIVNAADRGMAASQNATARSVYEKFRSGAEKDIAALLPEVGQLVNKYFA